MPEQTLTKYTPGRKAQEQIRAEAVAERVKAEPPTVDTDALLDDIEAALEENAVDMAINYEQAGGE